MTNPRNSTNPTGADKLATLVPRYRSLLDADNTDDSDSALAKCTWHRTWRPIARAPALTKADALAAIDLIEEELEITANLDEPFPSLIEALRGYINGAASS
jgi:hypothetical protein